MQILTYCNNSWKMRPKDQTTEDIANILEGRQRELEVYEAVADQVRKANPVAFRAVEGLEFSPLAGKLGYLMGNAAGQLARASPSALKDIITGMDASLELITDEGGEIIAVHNLLDGKYISSAAFSEFASNPTDIGFASLAWDAAYNVLPRTTAELGRVSLASGIRDGFLSRIFDSVPSEALKNTASAVAAEAAKTSLRAAVGPLEYINYTMDAIDNAVGVSAMLLPDVAASAAESIGIPSQTTFEATRSFLTSLEVGTSAIREYTDMLDFDRLATRAISLDPEKFAAKVKVADVVQNAAIRVALGIGKEEAVSQAVGDILFNVKGFGEEGNTIRETVTQTVLGLLGGK